MNTHDCKTVGVQGLHTVEGIFKDNYFVLLKITHAAGALQVNIGLCFANADLFNGDTRIQ